MAEKESERGNVGTDFTRKDGYKYQDSGSEDIDIQILGVSILKTDVFSRESFYIYFFLICMLILCLLFNHRRCFCLAHELVSYCWHLPETSPQH